MGFTLIAVIGTAFSCGCVDAHSENAQNGNGNITTPVSISLHDASEELAFMKDMLSEMRLQGKDVSALNAIYRDAKGYYMQDNMEEFEQSLDSFYAKCREISSGNKAIITKK